MACAPGDALGVASRRRLRRRTFFSRERRRARVPQRGEHRGRGVRCVANVEFRRWQSVKLTWERCETSESVRKGAQEDPVLDFHFSLSKCNRRACPATRSDPAANGTLSSRAWHHLLTLPPSSSFFSPRPRSAPVSSRRLHLPVPLPRRTRLNCRANRDNGAEAGPSPPNPRRRPHQIFTAHGRPPPPTTTFFPFARPCQPTVLGPPYP